MKSEANAIEHCVAAPRIRHFPFSISHFPFRPRGAFTLVELLVVVAIIVLILGIVGPAVTSMWNQRLESQAQIVVAGALQSVQMQARTRGERGLFFYLDGDVQKIAVIESTTRLYDSSNSTNPWIVTSPPPPSPPPAPTQPPEPYILADCFDVSAGFVYRVPSPYRVMPRGVVETNTTGNERYTWNDIEVNHEDVFTSPASPAAGNQRHRNFFSVVFGPDGRLRVGRDVLVHDPENRTGLLRQNRVAKYYDSVGNPVDFPTRWDGKATKPDGLVATPTTPVALNFPGVDGVLVYDESLFKELPLAGKAGAGEQDRRTWAARKGQPYYINRMSGELVRGPVGE
jgi:prepilin-type N-terminal cleavage/methylation domain-containing protein